MISTNQVELIEADLRERIFSGGLPPNSPLRISRLSRMSATGATPVREALSRLLSEGLVQWTPNKGFRVSPISRDDLLDIVTTRVTVELGALGLAMEKGDDRWEASIVAAHYLSNRILDTQIENMALAEMESVHHELHMALIQACGSPRLLRLAAQLSRHHTRYLRLAFARPTCNKIDMLASFANAPPGEVAVANILRESHQELVDAVLSRQVKYAQELLRDHLSQILILLDIPEVWDAYPPTPA
jgi:GntR family carbon starvation induced transcriptional regulator